jgi:hypothetical protein
MANSSYPADGVLVGWADSDTVWGPLLFLRPKPTEYLGLWRVLLTSSLLGGFQGMAANVGMTAANRLTGHATLPTYVLPLLMTLALALVLSVSLARPWNRRVDRLLRKQAWLEGTERKSISPS